MQYIFGLGQRRRVSILFTFLKYMCNRWGFSESVLPFGLSSIWNSSCGICHLVVNCSSRRAVYEAVHHFNKSTVNNFSNTSRQLVQDHQLFPGPAVSPSAERDLAQPLCWGNIQLMTSPFKSKCNITDGSVFCLVNTTLGLE